MGERVERPLVIHPQLYENFSLYASLDKVIAEEIRMLFLSNSYSKLFYSSVERLSVIKVIGPWVRRKIRIKY